jgi:hypothetical protein
VPKIRAYAPKNYEINQMASYVNNMSNRLSIPKLTSNDSKSSL